MRVIFALMIASLAAAAERPAAAPVADAVTDFALLDQRGKSVRLHAQADAKTVVIYIHGVGCPIVRQQVPDLSRLAAEYVAKGVRFYALNANPQDDRAAVVAECTATALDLPVLLDDSQLIAESLAVVRTAEALVIRTKDWRIVWRGPLDDRVGYGAQKPQATRRFLAEALDAVLAGQAPPADVPAAKGCAIAFTQPRTAHQPDYARDVAPLLIDRCAVCHREGGIGPWAMLDHKKVAGWSAMMREVVFTQRMPPWPADPAHGSFQHVRTLSAAERRTLVHWVDHGAKPAASDPLAAHRPPKPPEWPLGTPDLIIDLPVQNVPATGTLPYRTPTIDVTIDRDRWVRAVDLRPSNPKAMHHAFAFTDGDEISVEELPEEVATRLKPEDIERLKQLAEAFRRRPGQGGNNAAGRNPDRGRNTGLTSFFATYVPGLEPRPFPAGSGKLLKKGAKFSFQLHYTTYGEATVDRPRLGIYFHATPPVQELKVTSAYNVRLQIPPGVRESPTQAVRTFANGATVHALSPHMHYRGSWMKFTAEYPDGRSEVLLSVPRYDLDWQLTYSLATPKVLPPGAKVVVTGAFDNSSTNEKNPDATKAVRFGQQSWDEMFIGYVVYTEK